MLKRFLASLGDRFWRSEVIFAMKKEKEQGAASTCRSELPYLLTRPLVDCCNKYSSRLLFETVSYQFHQRHEIENHSSLALQVFCTFFAVCVFLIDWLLRCLAENKMPGIGLDYDSDEESSVDEVKPEVSTKVCFVARISPLCPRRNTLTTTRSSCASRFTQVSRSPNRSRRICKLLPPSSPRHKPVQNNKKVPNANAASKAVADANASNDAKPASGVGVALPAQQTLQEKDTVSGASHKKFNPNRFRKKPKPKPVSVPAAVASVPAPAPAPVSNPTQRPAPPPQPAAPAPAKREAPGPAEQDPTKFMSKKELAAFKKMQRGAG